MAAYLGVRLVQLPLVLFITSILIFALVRLIPGDPALVLAGPDATQDQLAAAREQMGLNESWPVQYGKWLGLVVQGNLGVSYISGVPVGTLLLQRAPATAELAIAAMVLSVLVGIPLGVLAAVRRGSLFDLVASAYTSIGLAMPSYWLGLLFILLFAAVLGWLPVGGRVSLADDPLRAWQYLLLPTLTLAIDASAVLMRFVRSAMLETLPEDFVRTARAKGLASRGVVVGHALRATWVSILTVIGLQTGRALGGAVIVESMFAWPGIGRLLVTAVGQRDYSVMQGTLLLLVVVFVVVNLITDVACGMVDPRARLGQRT